MSDLTPKCIPFSFIAFGLQRWPKVQSQNSLCSGNTLESCTFALVWRTCSSLLPLLHFFHSNLPVEQFVRDLLIHQESKKCLWIIKKSTMHSTLVVQNLLRTSAAFPTLLQLFLVYLENTRQYLRFHIILIFFQNQQKEEHTDTSLLSPWLCLWLTCQKGHNSALFAQPDLQPQRRDCWALCGLCQLWEGPVKLAQLFPSGLIQSEEQLL